MRRLLAAALLALAATGCARIPMGAPVPSADNILAARAKPLAPVALGDFKPAPTLDAARDQQVVARTNTFYSPYGSSFALYLREALAADLGAAGLLDPASPLQLSGSLVDSQLDVPNGPARASLAARFVLRRGGAVVYERELRASDAWQAPFIGVEAVPDAMNRYGLLYRRLVAALLADADFQAAVRR